MRVEKRTLKNGNLYYSFVYWNGTARVRLKKSDHPHFECREKAEEWAKSKEAEFASAKARVLKRLEWRKQYYDFSILVDEYIDHCKKAQPNSWKNTKIYLEQYVLVFFLYIKASNNPNNWNLHFEDFKTWLEEEARTTKVGNRIISYSTKNHCIKTLNTFLDYLKRHNKIDPANVYKVAAFSSAKLNTRDADSLISKEEFKHVHTLLKNIDQDVATFFETAYWTGMRFNEIFGLSLDDLFIGEIDDAFLKKALHDNNIEYFGYLVLESQPADKARKRLPDGSILRKPLKGKRKICEKYNRIVPIINKDLFNNLVRLYQKQEKKRKTGTFGLKEKNYLLFESLNHSKIVTSLRTAYSQTDFSAKGYHCCRHTRATELVGETRDFVLAKYWLGHARQETTMKYTHIYQQSVRAVRKKRQKIDFIA